MKVLFLSNEIGGIYTFRKELLIELINRGCSVKVCAPIDKYLPDMEMLGCAIEDNKYLNRRGTNPLQDAGLLCYYHRLLRRENPDIVLLYTIKPNVYGGLICGLLGIPYISNITGLGTAIQDGGILQRITIGLYKLGLRHAKTVLFQNESNKTFMEGKIGIDPKKTRLIPGSGVNVNQFEYAEYSAGEKVIFTFIGRIMKDKGIDEYLEAAKEIRGKYSNTEFRIIGEFDEEYEDVVKRFEQDGIVKYLGYKKNIYPYMRDSHAIVHPSYHEGMSNILLEASSVGRPTIASNIPGCREIINENESGLLFEPRNTKSLIEALEQFMAMTWTERENMGIRAREKIVSEFDRTIVVNIYTNEIFGH